MTAAAEPTTEEFDGGPQCCLSIAIFTYRYF